MSYAKDLKTHYLNIINGLNIDAAEKSILEYSWLDFFLMADSKAGIGWFRNNVAQVLVIVLSLFIPVIEKSRLNAELCDTGITVISVFGLMIGILSALNRLLDYQGKWSHYRKIAEAMRNEGDDFFALSGGYKEYTSHKEAFKAFMTVITAFKRKEVNNYVESAAGKQKNDGDKK